MRGDNCSACFLGCSCLTRNWRYFGAVILVPNISQKCFIMNFFHIHKFVCFFFLYGLFPSVKWFAGYCCLVQKLLNGNYCSPTAAGGHCGCFSLKSIDLQFLLDVCTIAYSYLSILGCTDICVGIIFGFVFLQTTQNI